MAQDDPPDKPDKSTQWAEFRTDLAEDRNIMAMERTFAGWMRTAFAAIGIGLWHYSEATRAALQARSGINAEHMTGWFQASVLSGENDNAVA